MGAVFLRVEHEIGRQQRRVGLAALHGGKGLRQVHLHEIDLLHAHALARQRGGQQLVQHGAFGAGDGLALQISHRAWAALGGHDGENVRRARNARDDAHRVAFAIGHEHGGGVHHAAYIQIAVQIAAGQRLRLLGAGGDFRPLRLQAQRLQVLLQDALFLHHHQLQVERRAHVADAQRLGFLPGMSRRGGQRRKQAQGEKETSFHEIQLLCESSGKRNGRNRSGRRDGKGRRCVSGAQGLHDLASDLVRAPGRVPLPRHAPGLHHEQAAAQRKSLVHVMRDEQAGGLPRGDELAQGRASCAA